MLELEFEGGGKTNTIAKNYFFIHKTNQKINNEEIRTVNLRLQNSGASGTQV